MLCGRNITGADATVAAPSIQAHWHLLRIIHMLSRSLATDSDYAQRDSRYAPEDSQYAYRRSHYPHERSDYASADTRYFCTDSDYDDDASDYRAWLSAYAGAVSPYNDGDTNYACIDTRYHAVDIDYPAAPLKAAAGNPACRHARCHSPRPRSDPTSAVPRAGRPCPESRSRRAR